MNFPHRNISLICLAAGVVSCAATKESTGVAENSPGERRMSLADVEPLPPMAPAKPAVAAQPAAPTVIAAEEPKKKGFFARVFGPQEENTAAAEVAEPQRVNPPPDVSEPVVADAATPGEEKKGFFARVFGPKQKRMGLSDVEPLPPPTTDRLVGRETPAAPPVTRPEKPSATARAEAPVDLPKPARAPKPPRGGAGDGFRLPDMLNMPSDNDLRKSAGSGGDGGGSVIVKPPTNKE